MNIGNEKYNNKNKFIMKTINLKVITKYLSTLWVEKQSNNIYKAIFLF